MFIGIKKLKKTEIKYKIKKPTIPCSPIFKFNLRNLSLKIKEALEKDVHPEDLNSFINLVESKSFKCDVVGLITDLTNEFFYNGFLSDVKITDQHFLNFLNDNSEQFSILANNYLKLIFPDN